MKMNTQQIIKEYTESIIKGDFRCLHKICEKCRQKPEIFKLHESRKRQLRFVVGDIVKVTLTFLLRWKCPLCGGTFTQYPSFILPHKRFVLTDIVQFGKKYLTNKDSNYTDTVKTDNADTVKTDDADTVKTDGTDIGYLNENDLCDHFFSPSSVWRFMEYLAGLYDLNRKLFRKKCEKSHHIPSSKYRSNQRKKLLY